MARLENDFPETNRGRGVRLFPLWQTPFNNAGALLPTLGIALVVVLSVLLIACANVGNLLLVRAFARQQEMTIRLSVGAGRARLVLGAIGPGADPDVVELCPARRRRTAHTKSAGRAKRESRLHDRGRADDLRRSVHRRLRSAAREEFSGRAHRSRPVDRRC